MRISSSFPTVISDDTIRILLQKEIAVHKKGKQLHVVFFRVEEGPGKEESRERSAKIQERPDNGMGGSKNYWMHNFERVSVRFLHF
jgi:hypothetical protein